MVGDVNERYSAALINTSPTFRKGFQGASTLRVAILVWGCMRSQEEGASESMTKAEPRGSYLEIFQRNDLRFIFIAATNKDDMEANNKMELTLLQIKPIRPTSTASAHRAMVVSPFSKTIRVASENTLSILSEDVQKDLIWYFERYIIDDPFALGRAEDVRRTLGSHGEALVRDFVSEEVLPKGRCQGTVIIAVYDVGEDDGSLLAHPIDKCIWEAIEDGAAWKQVRSEQPRRVCVVRCHSDSTEISPQSIPRTLGNAASEPNAKRILAITARVSQKDIPYRLITRSICDTVNKTPGATLDIVRPGTYQALIDRLCTYDPGYFDVLHLDLHGVSDEKG